MNASSSLGAALFGSAAPAADAGKGPLLDAFSQPQHAGVSALSTFLDSVQATSEVVMSSSLAPVGARQSAAPRGGGLAELMQGPKQYIHTLPATRAVAVPAPATADMAAPAQSEQQRGATVYSAPAYLPGRPIPGFHVPSWGLKAELPKAELPKAVDTSVSAAAEELPETVRPQKAAMDVDRAATLRDRLEATGDPKILRSGFLAFLHQVADGDVSIEVGSDGVTRLVDREGNEVQEMASSLPPPLSEHSTESLEAAWRELMEDGQMKEEELPFYKSVSQNVDPLKLLQEAFDGVSEAMQDQSPPVISPELHILRLSPSNPQLPAAASRSLLLDARQALLAGRNSEAREMLEAEVQARPDHADAWQELGQIYADLDLDHKALYCFNRLTSLELPAPVAANAQLQMAVALLNADTPKPVIGALERWVDCHDGGAAIAEDDEQRLRQLESRLTALPAGSDGGPAMIAGLVECLKKNPRRAYTHFRDALERTASADPLFVAGLWNKIGATLANSGNASAAIYAYHQALRLRPNYPRVWANLGVVHYNIGEYKDSVRFFLSAISLSPEATHLWKICRSASKSISGEVDVAALAEMEDIDTAVSYIPNVVTTATLPTMPEGSVESQQPYISQLAAMVR